MNAFLIPLFGVNSIGTLYSLLTSTTTIDIEMRAVDKIHFFTKFLTGLSLFSNVMTALDAPHWITRKFRQWRFSQLP